MVAVMSPGEEPEFEGPRLEDVSMSIQQWRFELAIVQAMSTLQDSTKSFEQRSNDAYCTLFNALVIGDEPLTNAKLPQHLGDRA